MSIISVSFHYLTHRLPSALWGSVFVFRSETAARVTGFQKPLVLSVKSLPAARCARTISRLPSALTGPVCIASRMEIVPGVRFDFSSAARVPGAALPRGGRFLAYLFLINCQLNDAGDRRLQGGASMRTSPRMDLSCCARDLASFCFCLGYYLRDAIDPLTHGG